MRKILASAIAIAIIGTSISSCGQVEETASNENEISSVSEVKSDYDSDINDENIKDNGASDDLSNNGDNIGDSSNILSSDLSDDVSELSSAYKDVFNKTMKGFINRDMYAAFNGALLINKKYDTNDIVKLFRDEQIIASTSTAFTDYIFDRITDFNDVYVLSSVI